MSKRILIIGANSQITKFLTPFHEEQGDIITLVYHEKPTHINLNYIYLPLDKLGNLDDNFSLVYIIAAYIPYNKLNTPSPLLYDINIRLVGSVCQQFKKARIIFCSSVSVYGYHHLNVDEKDVFIQPNLYGLTKIAGETIVRQHQSFAIVRFSSLYGNRMKARTFLPIIIEHALEKKTITLLGNGQRMQDYLHYKDAAAYLFHAGQLDTNEVFLGVYGHSISNKEIAEYIVHQLSANEIMLKFEGTDNSLSYNYDVTKTKNLLNFAPAISIEMGLKELIEWKAKQYSSQE